MRWVILSPEYPPQPGGVAAYTQQLAAALANAGDAVEVWAPGNKPSPPVGGSVGVRPLPGMFGRRARRVMEDRLSQTPEPYRILVQYVPSGFGRRGMNLGWAAWLGKLRPAPWMMYHEVAYPLEAGQSGWRRCLALATRHMAATIHRNAARAFVAIPAWGTLLQDLAPTGPASVCLPVPSNLPLSADLGQVARYRQQWCPTPSMLIGCFGAFRGFAGQLWRQMLPTLLTRHEHLQVLMIGAEGEEFLRGWAPSVAAVVRARLHAPGYLDGPEAAAAIAATDLMLQPYPDGISGRRGSAVAGLALDRATLTTSGELTEPFWAQSGAVALQPVASLPELAAALTERTSQLLADPRERAALGEAAHRLYLQRFALEHTVRALRAN